MTDMTPTQNLDQLLDGSVPPSPEELSVPVLPTAEELVVPAGIKMPTSMLYKGYRIHLVGDDMPVTRCAHCGMLLNDALSLQRCIGPVCAKRGYTEEPQNTPDEIQAMFDLSEFPELVQYLTAKYKPLGVRPLMNALLRICALNRRTPGLHAAICDAIESLGWSKLASLLRTSIAVLEIREADYAPGYYSVWVHKDSYTYGWSREMARISGIRPGERNRVAKGKGILVPMSAKRELWEAMLSFHPDCIARTPKGVIKISRKTVTPSDPPPATVVALLVGQA